MSTVNIHADRFRGIRKELGLTQKQLADRLLLSRNYIAQIEMGTREPSLRVLSTAEALLAKVDPAHRARPLLKTGGKPAPAVEEDQATFGQVALRIPQQRAPSTRQDCEAYAQQIFDAAELSEDPNAWPVIHDRLKKKFPLDEWEPVPKPE